MREHEHAHDRRGDREHVHARGGYILGALGERVHLLRGEVDDGLHRGVAEFTVNHKADADDDDPPLGRIEPHKEPRAHGKDAGDEHDVDVPLGFDGGHKALYGVAERADKRGMLLIGSGDHGSS